MDEHHPGLMAGKTVLVTGGTGGIGKATAAGLARLGARVGITGRDADRAARAAAEIGAVPGAGGVDVFIADLSVQAGVRALAASVLTAYPQLDVLVNNVGGLWANRHVTADGLERTFALNHLGPFLLTHLLLDRLTASAPARIVNLSSKGHAQGRIDFEDLQGHSGERAYSQSKLANVLFTYELARRLEGTGVTATVLHPGVVGTRIGDDDPMWYMPLVRLFGRTAEKGAATSVHLASSPQVEGLTGLYFVNGEPRPSARASYDRAAAARLWRIDEELVGLV